MEILDIKSKLSILTVLTHYHLSPDKNNRLCCPWHNDKTPSLQIYSKTNTWTCFSSNCNAGSGDAIEMIQRLEKGNKHEALIKAAELCGYVNPAQNQEETSLKDLFNGMRASLMRSKNTIKYLRARSIASNKLQIGYNPYSSGFKQLQNCIVFPLKDKSGNITSLYGRSIADKKGSNHYYLKNRKGLYPNYPSQETKTLIITEAIIDAATMVAHGGNYLKSGNIKTSVLALFGTNGWNEEHTEAVSQLKNLKEVIFFFDGDEAGIKAVETYSGLVKAMKQGIKISTVKTPEGEDVNSLVQSHDPEILNHLIDNRTFLFLPASETGEQAGSPEQPAASEMKKSESLQSSPKLDATNPEYMVMQTDELMFTILGGVGLYPIDRMKVTLRIQKKGSNRSIHNLRQTLDLYHDDVVEKMARKIAERMDIGSKKVLESLITLTDLLEQYRLKENEKRKVVKVEPRELTKERIEKAQAILEGKDLHRITNELIGKTGMVGEEKNRMILWYVFVSRLREQPLHVMCLGASGTGKTYLQERIGALIPSDHKKEITAMSDNAVYYFEEEELVNKLLLIEDLDGANEQKILYALRELMSKKRISKTIVTKDSKGNFKTIAIEVKGPICLAGTTTKESLYEDNSNRSLLVYLDNSKTQKERILDYQRKLSAGKIDRYEQARVVELMKDLQSVLKPIRVINPYAEELIIPSSVFKPLRTNSHYLQFIETVTFYHQRQREIKTDSHNNKYIETTIEDIEIATDLLKDILLAKSDELTKATRRFYDLLSMFLKGENREAFYSGQIRKAYRMSPTTVGRHLKLLTKYGYVKVVGGDKKRGYEYELEQNIEDIRSRVMTSLDEVLKKLKNKYLAKKP